MSEASTCIFCKIVCGEAARHLVCEDELTLTFMDIVPVSTGHTLVIPRTHRENLYEITQAELSAVSRRVRVVALAIRTALGPDGLTIAQLNGAAAGQTVFHYHMHLIPRSEGGPLDLHGRKPADPKELAATAARIRAALESHR